MSQHVGFKAPAKPESGKKLAIFDTSGNHVGHTDSLAGAKYMLTKKKGGGPAAPSSTKTPSAPGVSSSASHVAQVKTGVSPKTDEQLKGMTSDELAGHLGESITKLGSHSPYTKKVLAELQAKQEPSKAKVPEAPSAPPQWLLVGGASPFSKQEATKVPKAPSVSKVPADAYPLYDANTGHVGYVTGGAGTKKYNILNINGNKVGEADTFTEAKLTLSGKLTAHANMPKYAKNSSIPLKDDNGNKIGYYAALPAPMKKYSGHNYGVFDTNGNKVGHASTKDGMLAVLAGHKAEPGNAPQVVKAKPVQQVSNVQVKNLSEVGSIGTVAPKTVTSTTPANTLFAPFKDNQEFAKKQVQIDVTEKMGPLFWNGKTAADAQKVYDRLSSGSSYDLPHNVTHLAPSPYEPGRWRQAAPSDLGALSVADGEKYKVAMSQFITYRLTQVWAGTSNDESSAALSIQDIAEEMFGVKDSFGWTPEIDYGHYKAANHDVFAAFLQAQYNNTQAHLKAQGITSVTVKRGFSFYHEPGWAQKLSVNGSGSVVLRPLSSFSVNASTAKSFGDYMIIVTVPASKVLSMAGTGFGCLNEREVVVIGGNITATRLK